MLCRICALPVQIQPTKNMCEITQIMRLPRDNMSSGPYMRGIYLPLKGLDHRVGIEYRSYRSYRSCRSHRSYRSYRPSVRGVETIIQIICPRCGDDHTDHLSEVWRLSKRCPELNHDWPRMGVSCWSCQEVSIIDNWIPKTLRTTVREVC